MGGACSTHGYIRNANKIKLFWRPWCRMESYVKMEHKHGLDSTA